MTVGILLLAAGRSVRFGSDKRLALLPDGKTVFETTLGNIQASNLPVLVCLENDVDDAAKICDRMCANFIVCENANLGMGYTLAAALEQSGPDAQILVAELIPAIVKWNREYLGHLAGRPLLDPRVRVAQEDVVKTIGKQRSAWDAILLDVDNGPAGLTRRANDRLYGNSGLKASFDALKPGGILAVWSSAVDEAFTRRMKGSGFETKMVSVRARKSGKGSKHTIWLGKKP